MCVKKPALCINVPVNEMLFEKVKSKQTNSI